MLFRPRKQKTCETLHQTKGVNTYVLPSTNWPRVLLGGTHHKEGISFFWPGDFCPNSSCGPTAFFPKSLATFPDIVKLWRENLRFIF